MPEKAQPKKSRPGGDIRAFFKPQATGRPSLPTPQANSSHTQLSSDFKPTHSAPTAYEMALPAVAPSASNPQSSQALLFSSSPLSSPPSSPRYSRPPSLPPLRYAPTNLAQSDTSPRSRVIEDSDDDSSDSDDDMEDLLPSLFKTRDVPVPAQSSTRRPNTCVTPNAKRIAVPDFSSPLTVRPRHTFDFKTLLEHEDEHKRSLATMKLVADEMHDDDENKARNLLDSPHKFKSPRHVSAREVRQEIIRNTIHGDPDRARRAERAMEKVNAGAETWAWYFLDPEKQHPLPRGPEFPSSAPPTWKTLLGDEGSRQRHLDSCLPLNIAKMVGVPRDVYLWILKQLPCEPSLVCRDHYTRILASTRDSERQPVFQATIPSWINELFEKLGAQSDLDSDSELIPVAEVDNAYKGQDWSILCTVLRFLTEVAPQLSQAALNKIGIMALKMSTDKAAMAAPGVRNSFRTLMVSLMDTETCPEQHWKEFCDVVSQNLFSSLKEPFLQVQSLVYLPVNTSRRAWQFRKGLAAVFLFGDPSIMAQPSKVTLQDLSDRLRQKDLKPSRDVDYADMRSLAWLWEVAVDDGSRGSRPERQFNEDIDGLIQQVEFLQTSVKSADAGAVDRLQAKEFLVGLTSRLQISVRTEPPMRKDHYDDARERAAARAKEEEETKEKQKLFMDKFIGGQSKAANGLTSKNSGCTDSG